MSFYIPETLCPVEQLEYCGELSFHEIERMMMLGIETVPVSNGPKDLEMAYYASVKALAEANLHPLDLDAIILLQSRAPRSLISSAAGEVQHFLGAKRAICFSIGDLGCANISQAISVAVAYLRSNEQMRHILICCGSTPVNHRRYRMESTILGDAGMGLVVSKNCENNIILDHKVRCDGKFSQLYQVEYQNVNVENYQEICQSKELQFELTMSAQRIFKEINSEILNQTDSSKVKFAMQNLSLPALAFNEKLFDMKLAEACFANCRQYGHLGSIDIILNYHTGIQNQEFCKDDLVLLMNSSPSACWGALLVKV